MDLIRELERARRFLSVCPHPQKVKFRSKAKARKRAREIGSMDYYQCVCGDWHLTTKVVREPECPICGAPIDDGWGECGCFDELTGGWD